jgi:uncharacterized damage-inducible protein DinB
MTTGTTSAAVSEAVGQADTALARLQQAIDRLADGDLARAHRGGGWSVAQLISHINLSNLVWVADVQRLVADPSLTFFFREEIGHDAVGYPPPTVEIAARQLAAARATVTSALPAIPAEILARTVTIPDLGTMTVAEWTPLIVGHVVSHVEQAFEIMHDRGFVPEGI